MGLVNTTGGIMTGLQFGIYNYACQVKGVQIGVLGNGADSLDGIQFGCINYNGTEDPMLVMIIANWSF